MNVGLRGGGDFPIVCRVGDAVRGGPNHVTVAVSRIDTDDRRFFATKTLRMDRGRTATGLSDTPSPRTRPWS
jgi:hypothetical protein